MTEVAILFQNGTYAFFPDIKSSKFYPYYPGLKAQLDVSKYIEGNAFKSIRLEFKESKDYDIKIELDDSSWDSVRPLYRRTMRQKGTKICLKK